MPMPLTLHDDGSTEFDCVDCGQRTIIVAGYWPVAICAVCKFIRKVPSKTERAVLRKHLLDQTTKPPPPLPKK